MDFKAAIFQLRKTQKNYLSIITEMESLLEPYRKEIKKHLAEALKKSFPGYEVSINDYLDYGMRVKGWEPEIGVGLKGVQAV